MKRHKENTFTKKFDLLNSQEHNEDIRWSSSESSDYENVTNNVIHGPSTFNNHRKRKRKKNVQKNLSNLSFNIIKAVKEDKKLSNSCSLDKSPIISRLYIETKQHVEKSSPILSSKAVETKREIKSPVLLFKQKPSVASPTIKKRLFVVNNLSELNRMDDNIKPNVDLGKSSNCKNKIDPKAIKSISHNNKNYAAKFYANKIYDSTEMLLKECGKINSNETKDTKVLPTNSNVAKTIDVSKPRSKVDLVKRVQSYFDSQFGSDTSQQSISESETLTQKSISKSSDDLEITNSLTQTITHTIQDNCPLLMDKSSSVVSHGSWEVKLDAVKSKKTKYKRDGMAYRLNHLLRKQNANISLWQHEKFLAGNSKFIIPKSEHIVFRIQKVNFKYGCYILEAVDLIDEQHLIFINGYYVNSAFNLAPNVILKLYLPYKILDLSNNYKIVINVCKFDCLPIVS